MLDLLRGSPMSVAELGRAMGVTATAVRQRLVRLTAQGLVTRATTSAARGRPGHRYSLTEKARRQAPSNFADLAAALWDEVRDIKDIEIRRGLLRRLAQRLAESYSPEMTGETVAERMEALTRMFDRRDIHFSVDQSGQLPILTAAQCPYPGLAEQNPGVCAMERMLFSELVGQSLRLDECRLDGGACCTFLTN
jgi:predicted ArsR family transcriptional regulator